MRNTFIFFSLLILIVSCTPAARGDTTPPPAGGDVPPPAAPPAGPTEPPAPTALGSSTLAPTPPSTGEEQPRAGATVSTTEMDNFIKGMIQGGMRNARQVIAQPHFADYRVFRDGAQKGVVFEYTFAKGSTLRPANPAASKLSLIKDLKNKGIAATLEKYMKAGLYIVYHYKRFDGTTYMKIVLGSADF